MLEIECYQKLKRDIELHGCIKGHFLENAFQPPPPPHQINVVHRPHMLRMGNVV